jgi:hypothetical protein
MPAQPFTVHVDPDDLARRDLHATVSLPAAPAGPDDRPRPGAAEQHHGAHDDRLAARQRSGRDRAGRASGATSGRAYAFRRS